MIYHLVGIFRTGMNYKEKQLFMNIIYFDRLLRSVVAKAQHPKCKVLERSAGQRLSV
jgi:fido (protein-threonine AMPylation protein)